MYIVQIVFLNRFQDIGNQPSHIYIVGIWPPTNTVDYDLPGIIMIPGTFEKCPEEFQVEI